jgi:flavodoxin
MRKIITVYYSYTGVTRALAQKIHARAGGDILELLPQEPYPADYAACIAKAKAEIASHARPPLQNTADIANYDLILLGSPIWCGTAATPIFSFLDDKVWYDKSIAPFFTHGGGGPGIAERDIAEATTRAMLLPSFSVKCTDIDTIDTALERWIGMVL